MYQIERNYSFWHFNRTMTQIFETCTSPLSIGAVRVKARCSNFRESCSQGNMEGCLRSFQKLKREHAVLRQKLENYFQMLKQVTPAEKAAC